MSEKLHKINKFANYQNIIVRNSPAFDRHNFVSSQDRWSMVFDVMRMYDQYTNPLAKALLIALQIVRTSFGFHLRECMRSSFPPPPPPAPIYIVYAVEQFKHEIYMRNQQRHSSSFFQSLIIIIALFQKLVNSTKELLLLQEGNVNTCQFWNHYKSAISVSVAERCLESKNFSFFRQQS